MRRRDFLAGATAALTLPVSRLFSAAAGAAQAPAGERHLLYIAQPGIRNYVRYGGVGVLVYDIDDDYRFVKRIPTWSVPEGQQPENVKGVAASAATGRLYVSTIRRLGCIDLVTEQMIWEVEPEGGCDRMSLSPDATILYVPSFEKEHWNVVDAMTGATVAKVVLNNRAHNTIYGPDGSRVYCEGLRSPMLHVIDPTTHTEVMQVGPFIDSVRPFTIDSAQTLCYVNCNNLLGFEIGDLRTGRKLHSVEVTGYQKGPVDRHGCPSHGIGLTPDETEIWVSDGHNKAMHVFDNTVMPPKQMTTLPLRDQPGWVTFTIDGRHAYPSTGEVFDTRSKQLIASLDDEEGRQIGSEKLLEIVFDGTKPVRNGDQFGIGRKS
jgi:DNA-binding beta-propeller fold protein YncE